MIFDAIIEGTQNLKYTSINYGAIMQLKKCSTCQQHYHSSVQCPYCTNNHTRSFPAWSLLLGLGLGGCQDADKDLHPAYGVEVVDMDGDGFDSEIDCNDDDPEIHPDAEEILDDDIDSNCDGEDNT